MKHIHGMVMGFVLFILVGQVLAGHPPPSKKFKHADRNHDGRIDRREYRQEKKFEHKQKSIVNTPREVRADKNRNGRIDPYERKHLKKKYHSYYTYHYVYYKSRPTLTYVEKQYDINGDGYLSELELNEMIEDRLTLIQTQGQAKVNTAMERKYDADGDGIISLQEAATMQEAQ